MLTPEIVEKAEAHIAERNAAAFQLLHRLYHDPDIFNPAAIAKYPEVIAILGAAKWTPPKARLSEVPLKQSDFKVGAESE